ncbi:MAG: DUF2190 family protein [Peptococcaceae bacterium]|jgi:predicted RecA/RadA family phage recombinase|nr:DUF2190 family protein [Peptococcaceae bacterium]MDH7525282.1 DUF2190 family protein [Peptococcaceae bacterium]
MPYIQKGDTIDYLNGGAALAYGDVVNLTTRIGVAGEAIAAGATGSVHVAGVFELPAINNTAFAVGDALYWDPNARVITNVQAGNVPAGWATEPKALAGTTARVKIG